MSVNKKMDSRFNIPSYEQYLLDLPVKKYTKMCMTEVINADMMIATFGEENYYNTSREILESGNIAYKQMNLDSIIHVYINSYKHFMAVANDDISDEDFLNLMKVFHEQYELANAQQTGLGGVSRFVLAFGDDLVNRIKSAYYVHNDFQNNFIVVTDEKERLATETEQNLKLFDLLNYAINNDKVVPFYQGIYNSELQKITKYEALMRIFDENDKMYVPGMFLEAANQLKLYLTISKITIDKALKDFENKDYDLGLNISLSDIRSEDFRDWFLNRIKDYKNKNRVTIEFVETEDYNSDDVIIGFLKDIREIGCKIAVDDFGAGFATYTSMISLKPDTLKIDGSIIKNLNNKENRIILDSICYMANLIDAKIVAEFVENEEIQKIVIENNIKYSQGYYFSKPQPIEDIKFD